MDPCCGLHDIGAYVLYPHLFLPRHLSLLNERVGGISISEHEVVDDPTKRSIGWACPSPPNMRTEAAVIAYPHYIP